MENQKNNKALKIVAIVLAAVLAVLLIAIAVLTIGSKPEDVPAEPSTEPSASTAPSEEAAPEEPVTVPVEEETEPVVAIAPETPDVAIETPYCTLYFPGEWEELLSVEQVTGDVHTVIFSCKLDADNLIELFRISFGDKNGIGQVKASDGELVNLSVMSTDIQPDENWTTSQTNMVFGMQEALNEVLQRIEFVEQKTTEPTVIPEDDSPSDLDTPYGTLKYPARWDAYLVTKTDKDDGYSVKFSAKIGSHDEEHLFTVYFGGEEGIEAGTVKDSSGKEVVLRLAIPDLELDGSWSEDERLTLLAMQEDMNYLLSNLPK